MPHTLLLADDSLTIQRVIELTFADEDVTVVTVSDGDQAIERIEASPPDIVLADITMPGKSGYEVAQYMRRSPRLEHIPVVLLTGAFEPVDQARADDAGCDSVLAKPFEPQMVIGRVKELLSRSQRTTAAPSDLHSYFDRLDTAIGHASPDTVSGDAADEASIPPRSAPQAGLDWFSGLGETDPKGASDSARTTEPAQDLPASASTAQTEALAALIKPPQEQLARVSDVEPIPALAAAADSASIADAPPDEHAAMTEPEVADAPVKQNAPVEVPPFVPTAHALNIPTKNPPLPPLADAFAALLAAEKAGAVSAEITWPGAASSPAVVSDEMIESIARRVLERLSDAVVRQMVSDIAERLIREEIERIRAAIK